MATPERRPIVFISYSHRDSRIKDRLVEHISVLGATDFELWDDSQIQTGDNWRRRISDGLSRADAGVLLISTDFLTSNFIKTVELPILLSKSVYPILIGYCAWQSVGWLEKLQMRTDDGEPLGTRGQKLDKGLVEVAREMALLYRAKPTISLDPCATALPPAREQRGELVSEVWVDAPAWYLAIVLQKDQRTGPVFNLRCRVLNEGVMPATMQRFDIRLTDPHGSTFGLKWNLFYEGDLVHLKVADAYPLALPPKSDQLIGIQFVGPPSIVHYEWSEGLYNCELMGQLADGRPADVLARCEIMVTAENVKDLIYWGRAGAAQWEALNDPNDAVGIPVRIWRRSPAPARR
jgi:hypothetical protein